MQRELEVGVRFVLDARHKANELAHVALLSPIHPTPGLRQGRHTSRAPAVLSEVAPALARVRAAAAVRIAIARVRDAVTLNFGSGSRRWRGCVCVLQSHLIKFRNIIKGEAVVINFIDNSLGLTLVDGLTSDVKRAATSHSMYRFAQFFGTTIRQLSVIRFLLEVISSDLWVPLCLHRSHYVAHTTAGVKKARCPAHRLSALPPAPPRLPVGQGGLSKQHCLKVE